MGKPAKIRKKKSFMFTTRHYSVMSIMGIVIAAVTIGCGAGMVMESYKQAGTVSVGFGGVGLFSAFLNIIGILCGVISLGERDIYIYPAIVAISANGLILLSWIVLILISIFG